MLPCACQLPSTVPCPRPAARGASRAAASLGLASWALARGLPGRSRRPCRAAVDLPDLTASEEQRLRQDRLVQRQTREATWTRYTHP